MEPRLLIDADIICYRVGFAASEDPVEYALSSTDKMIYDILLAFPELDPVVYLTGEGNFRELRAVTAPYKGNRDKSARPEHYDAIRQHLIDEWDAIVVDNMEADDAIAMATHSNDYKDIIVSIDKDFDQVPGRHYNFVKRLDYEVDPDDAMRFLYEQILTGDSVDNIIGIYRVGPVKAKKILAECETEREMYLACVKAYEELDETKYPIARVVENANLVFLLRKEGEHWTVPEPIL